MIFSNILSQLNSSEFSDLRPMQESVLEKYSFLIERDGRVRERDVAIEMPSGTGKTLVAFLIAEYHRRHNRSVVMLTGTRQLAKQVAEDASLLGIEAFVFEGPGHEWSQTELGKYKNAEHIAIMNYWAYFNVNPRPTPAEILILDDAHLAENPISSLFSICLDRSYDKDLFTAIIELIRSLHPGRYPVIEDISREIPTDSPFLLPFNDWFALSNRIIELLDIAADERNERVRFIWPSIRPNSDSLALYITPHEIQIRPIIFPTNTLRHFSEPIQRIYLSATLNDPQDFQRRIGSNSIYLIQPSDPQPGERGRRMIVLFPSKEEGDLQEGIISQGLKTIWPVARKRFWMCSSWREAERWKEWVPPLKNASKGHIWEIRGSDETQLEEFRQAPLGHLFTASRYDGIDLPGDQCRFAIIPSPPVRLDPQEEFFLAFLRDATFLKSRFSQRVAQALGRCNRGAADFAAYIFLDPRFERKFGGNDPDYLLYLPFDIQPEMEAALYYSESGFEECCKRARDFLLGKFEQWDHQVEKLRSKAKNLKPTYFLKAESEVDGWLALWRGDPVRAVERFQVFEKECSQKNNSGLLAFTRYCLAWARYLCYLRQEDPSGLTDSISYLEKAASVGPSSWFTNVLRATANDLRKIIKKPEQFLPNDLSYKDSIFEQWEMILYERGQKENSINKWLNKLQEDIQSDNHDQVCEGLNELGQLLGFDSFRPKGQGMPDVVWRFSLNLKFIFTWEAKIEKSPKRKLTMTDINQAHGHGRWAEKSFSADGYKCYPLILASSIEFEEGVRDRLGNITCLSQSTVDALWKMIRGIFDEFRVIWNANDAEKRQKAKSQCFQKIPSSEWFVQAISSNKKGVIPEVTLLSCWK